VKRVAQVALLLLAACGPDADGDGGAVLTVVNTPDSFSLSGAGGAHDGVKTWGWSCGDDQAEIVMAEAISSGTIRLEVFDASGALVHDNTFPALQSGSVTAFTAPGGAPGVWTVRFTFVNATWAGAIVLRADGMNEPDAITVAGSYSMSATWIWNPGWAAGPAQVTIASGLSSGTIRVRAWDGAGLLVYDQTFAAPMSAAVADATAPGAAGTWTVRLDVTNAVNGGAVVLKQG
jgi:hypothetical protein